MSKYNVKNRVLHIMSRIKKVPYLIVVRHFLMKLYFYFVLRLYSTNEYE